MKNKLNKITESINKASNEGRTALIPFKLITEMSGVNFTGSLDIIRTSPTHGTAYNLVGKKIASYQSLLNCFKYIKKIDKNRNTNN